MNNLKLTRKLKLTSKPTLKPTSNYKIHLAGGQASGLSNDESSGDLGRRLFDKNPPASLEVGGRSSGLSNDESIGDFGRWLFANPAASPEVVGRALGLWNYKASVSEAKIGKMRLTRPTDALERSRYAQSNRVCGETFDNLPRGHRGDRPCND